MRQPPAAAGLLVSTPKLSSAHLLHMAVVSLRDVGLRARRLQHWPQAAADQAAPPLVWHRQLTVTSARVSWLRLPASLPRLSVLHSLQTAQTCTSVAR